MPTISNANIAKKYNVSKASVTKWVQFASEGKNDLKVIDTNGKVQVLDNEQNQILLEQMAENARIYRSGKSLKKVDVSDDFYKIFNQDEQLEIITDLEAGKSINQKYWYKNKGAKFWDELYFTDPTTIQKATDELMQNNIDLISYFAQNSKLNVIDIGCGNAYPIKSLLEAQKDKISKYIPIDISQDMLDIASSNAKKWIKSEIKPYLKDIEVTRFQRIFMENIENQETKNIVCAIGNTLVNQDDRVYIYKNIKAGMRAGDLFVFTLSLNVDANKANFSQVRYDPIQEKELAWTFNLLGFDTELFDVSLVWDEKLQRKVKIYRLDKDYDITFKIFGKNRIVKLQNGLELTRWVHYLFDLDKIQYELGQAGFKITSYTEDRTKCNALIICEV